MKKLNCSHSSKKYLEEKYGVKSKPISDSLERKLKNASESAYEKISHNNYIYNESNAHANETIVTEEICEFIQEKQGPVLKKTRK